MNKKYILISVFGLLVLVCLPFIGQVKLDIQSLFGDNSGSFIFWQLRVPVTVLSFIVGSTLALAGLIFQNIFKNSLATPYTLGVSSGSAAAAVLAIKMNISLSFLGMNGIYLYGFIGALITIFLIIGIAKFVRSFSIYTLLMCGIALNFFFSSIILLIQYLSDYAQTHSVLRWLMGSLEVAGYNEIIFLLPLYFFFIIATFLLRNDLILLSAGDSFAHSKGMNVRTFRVFILIIVSFIVGVVVTIAGPIGFIGLIVPHISRLIFKNDFKAVIYFTIFIGGLLLVLTNFLAKNIMAPVYIPVGIITSFIGAPFFLFVLISKLKKHG